MNGSETVVIYDPAREYLPVWYRPERGDVILDPTDARTWAWDSADEVRTPVESMTMATSLVPHRVVETNTFFTDSARTVLAYLLAMKQSPAQLVSWLTNEERLLKLLRGTTLEHVLPIDSPQQRSGVMSPLGLVARSLELCPTPAQCQGRRWSAASWSERRQGWIFVTSTAQTREQLRPLQTLWLDSIILRLMCTPGRPVKLIFEELASLNRLWQLHTALTEGRKHNLAVILSFQGHAQVDDLYGKKAETMLAQPANKIFFRSADARSAERASKTIGEIEIDRVEESRQDGWAQTASTNLGLRRHVEPLFMPSEIEGWPNLRAVVKVGNLVTTLSLPYVPRAARHPAFVPRDLGPLPTRATGDHEPPLPPTTASATPRLI